MIDENPFENAKSHYFDAFEVDVIANTLRTKLVM